MRKFRAGQSLDPVLGNTYVVSEDIGEPDFVILFKEQITDETAGNYPVSGDSQGRVDFVNKTLAAAGKEELTTEEVAFLLSQG
jgi:hypothetical protein